MIPARSGLGGLPLAAAMTIFYVMPASAEHIVGDSNDEATHGPRLVMPLMSSVKGKSTFVDKGCVACHAINGVGGHDSPPLDAHDRDGFISPFDFAARMWNHAPGMIAAQEFALGEQIVFTGQELADIIAFIHDDAVQHDFRERDLTPDARRMMNHLHEETSPSDDHAEEIGHPK